MPAYRDFPRQTCRSNPWPDQFAILEWARPEALLNRTRGWFYNARTVAGMYRKGWLRRLGSGTVKIGACTPNLKGLYTGPDFPSLVSDFYPSTLNTLLTTRSYFLHYWNHLIYWSIYFISTQQPCSASRDAHKQVSEYSIQEAHTYPAMFWTIWSNGLPWNYGSRSCGCDVVVLCLAKHEMFLPRFQTKSPYCGGNSARGEEISCFSILGVFI